MIRAKAATKEIPPKELREQAVRSQMSDSENPADLFNRGLSTVNEDRAFVIDDEPAHAQIRWTMGRSRVSIGDGQIVVQLGGTVGPIGSSGTVRQRGGLLRVVVLPWVPRTEQMHILVRGESSTVFVTPRISERHFIVSQLKEQGFEIQLHEVPAPLSPILGFFFKPILWIWASSRGWLSLT